MIFEGPLQPIPLDDSLKATRLRCLATEAPGVKVAPCFPRLVLLIEALGEREIEAGSWLAHEPCVAQTVSFPAGLIRAFYRPNAPVFNPQLGVGFMTLETFLSLTLLPSCVGGEEGSMWLLCRVKM